MVQYSSANGKEIARSTSTTVYDILEIPSQSVIVGDYTQEAIANLNQNPEIQHVIKDENVDHLNEHPTAVNVNSELAVTLQKLLNGALPWWREIR